MLDVAPGATFETSIDWGITGLTGTLRYRIVDGAGATIVAATTTGVAEYPTGSSLYEVAPTAPGTAGQYRVVWDDQDDNYANGDDINVSGATPEVGGSGQLYVTRAELKLELNITVATYDTRIDHIVTAVSRAIDVIQRTRYFTTSETRYYTPRDWQVVDIDDLTTVSSLAIDPTGNGSYGTTWTAGTQFTLEPVNNALENKPYRQIIVRPQSGARLPRYRNSVKIVGTFGYPELPAQINQAAVLLASRLYNRRDAPFGAIALGGLETASVVRIARTDPDVMMLLESVDKKPGRLVA